MSTSTGRFSREDRLRHAREFRRVARGGRRAASGAFVVLAAPGRAGTRSRLGLTVSRKVGNAVVRNRVKRRVREWFRAARSGVPGVWDLVVIARREAAELESARSRAELSRLVAEGTGR